MLVARQALVTNAPKMRDAGMRPVHDLPPVVQWLLFAAVLSSLGALQLILSKRSVGPALILLVGGTLLLGLGGYAITTAFPRSPERSSMDRMTGWDRRKPWLAALLVGGVFALIKRNEAIQQPRRGGGSGSFCRSHGDSHGDWFRASAPLVADRPPLEQRDSQPFATRPASGEHSEPSVSV